MDSDFHRGQRNVRLALVSTKGGVGKTTLSGHIAVEAERHGMGPVGLIDMDPQGSLSQWWNVRARPTPIFATTSVDRAGEDVARLTLLGARLTVIDTPPSPFDLIEAESELIAAYNVEYTGMKFALFYAGEYAHTFAVSGLAATVFLGGYLGPSWLPGPVWLLLKMLGLFGLVLWVRWSFLRLRIDQALALNWKILFPLALGNLLVAAGWVVGRGGG